MTFYFALALLVLLFISHAFFKFRLAARLKVLDRATWEEIGRGTPFSASWRSTIAALRFVWGKDPDRYGDAELSELVTTVRVIEAFYLVSFLSLVLLAKWR
ncbi:MAG: hypothetical protein AB7G12_06860 [Thermoanaerobaculia bacterium]